MGMTIDEAIKEIDWSSKVHKKILETDAKELDIDSAWVNHWKSVVEALNMAITTMRKYQKIEQILKDIPYGGEATVRRIQEVVEDGTN